MSLILDALKRVERDRRVERAPDLSTLYESEPVTRRRRWPWILLIIVLALNLLVLGSLFRPEKSPRQPAMQAPAVSPAEPKPSANAPTDATSDVTPSMDAASEPPVLRPAPPPPEPREPPSARDLSGPTRPLSQEARVVHAPKERPSRTPPPSPEKALVTASVQASETSVGRPDARPDPEAVPVAKVAEPPSPAPTEKQPVDDVRPSPATGPEETQPPPLQRAEPAAVSASRGDIPMVMDLPDEIREKFKDLKINVHAFYENSAESFVFINMRRYVAGDRVGGNNITLVAITPDGVVLDYGEGQALLLTEN